MTIRLHNAGNTVISCNLMGWSPRLRTAMRRGMMMTPVAILPGKSIDVCRILNVSLQEAEMVVMRSPEVRAFVAKGVLKVLGPEPEPLPARPVVVEEPPAPVEVAPVDLSPVPDVVPEAEDETPPAEVTVGDEPSMDWTFKQLRAHAEALGIDVTELRSKPLLLRAIRGES